jgi:hypothetical protein
MQMRACGATSFTGLPDRLSSLHNIPSLNAYSSKVRVPGHATVWMAHEYGITATVLGVVPSSDNRAFGCGLYGGASFYG